MQREPKPRCEDAPEPTSKSSTAGAGEGLHRRTPSSTTTSRRCRADAQSALTDVGELAEDEPAVQPAHRRPLRRARHRAVQPRPRRPPRNTAKEYLVTLGVDAGRIRTVSYGEERPFDHGHDEAAWAKNRRDASRARRKIDDEDPPLHRRCRRAPARPAASPPPTSRSCRARSPTCRTRSRSSSGPRRAKKKCRTSTPGSPSRPQTLLKSNATLVAKVDQIEDKMNNTQGSVEQTNYRVDQLAQQLDAGAARRRRAEGCRGPRGRRRSARPRTRGRRRRRAGRTPPAVTRSTSRPAPARPGADLSVGLSRLPARQLRPGRSPASRSSSAKNPNSDLADNAAYWIGESLLLPEEISRGDRAVRQRRHQIPEVRQGAGRAAEEGLRLHGPRREGARESSSSSTSCTSTRSRRKRRWRGRN